MCSTRSNAAQIDQCLTSASFCMHIFSLYFNIVKLIYEMCVCVCVCVCVCEREKELGTRRHDEVPFPPQSCHYLHPSVIHGTAALWGEQSALYITGFCVLQTDWSVHDARGDFCICRLTKWGHTWTTSPGLLWESLHEHFTVWFE